MNNDQEKDIAKRESVIQEDIEEKSIEEMIAEEKAIKHLNNPAAAIKPITKKYLSAVKSVEQQGNRFYFSDGDARVEVRVVSDDIIRVRLAPHGVFLDEFSYAVQHNPDQRVAVYRLSEDEDDYTLSTGTVLCKINKAAFTITFSDNHEQVICRDASPMHWEENAQFGGYYVFCTKDKAAEENFFGLGDKASELNLRGKRLQNWNTDAYSYGKYQDPLYRSIPFYISINEATAHGIFFDNTFRSHFDFGHENPARTSFWADGGELQYYFINGPHMMDVVKRYHTLTGTHPMPPMWALGYHQCRWSYYPEKRVKAIGQEFRKRKIPCDAIYLDIDHMDGYRCFTWNKKYFPNPKKLIKELADEGFKTVVMIDPGIKVDDNYWVFREGKEKKYFCRRSDDYFMEGHVWPGRCQFPDFTNPEVREWWGGLYEELVDMGVAGIWNDMNEPAVFGTGTFPDDVRHNYDGYRGSHRKAHNIYGMQMVRATFDGLRKLQKNKRTFTITRAGYSGVQRYALVWTGDNIASWEHLQIGARQIQRLSVSGISFCGTDIGGFSGEPGPELFTRWMQLGVFSPFMRAHSAGDTNQREPWSFGEPYESINRKFIELRYKLLPYIYSAFWEHHKYGFPVIRPIVMQEQENVKNHYREDEFTFGDKILVCPVLSPDVYQRNVYLPKGKWYQYWTHELLEGGEEVPVKTPIDSMPVFVKAGSVIPEYPVMQYTGEFDLDQMIFQVYHNDYEVNSFYYEDHGDTFAFEQDIYTEKHFVTNGDASSFSMKQFEQGMYTPRYDAYHLKLIGLPFEPKKAFIDGKEVTDFKQDELKRWHLVVRPDFKLIHILA